MKSILWIAVGLLGLASASPAQTNAAKSSLAEPFWTHGFTVDDKTLDVRRAAGAPRADILVWVPEGAKHIRAMMLIPNNSDSKGIGEWESIRKVAAKHEMAVVYLRNFGTAIEHTQTPDPDRIQTLLDRIVKETNIAEFRFAPWITVGKSSRGEFPFRMAWLHPQRTIATITWHGETPVWPPAKWAKLNHETIFHISINGETEWGGTWFNHVRPSLLNYRAKQGWLAHQVVSKGVDHGNYPDGGGSYREVPKPGQALRSQAWDYLALYIDNALTARLPKDRYPTDGPVTLKTVDESTGYLIDPFAVEALYNVPNMPLVDSPTGFVPNPPMPPATGYTAFTPIKDFNPPEGVPVVKPNTKVEGFKEWLITDAGPPMKADPMLELGELQRLMPKPDDMVTIDDTRYTFRPTDPGEVAPAGGIRPPSGKFTLLAYTVLDITEKRHYRLHAPFTPATSQQIVLNGVPIRHGQIVDLQPGRYPLLMVVRMTVKWNRIGPWFQDVTAEQVEFAKKMQVEVDQRTAEEARQKTAGPRPTGTLIRKAADVPAAERSRLFWVANREQAEAWFKLHAIHGQQPTIP